MPKAILQFNLPEEQVEFEETVNGGKYRAILQEIAESLRVRLKYEDHSAEYQDACESIRDALNDALREYNLTLY